MSTINAIIIDDEAPARRRILKLIKDNNCIEIIAEAESGKEAITKIMKLNPDLLFLDIQLKDMTGFEVLKVIGNNYNGAIIFITAYDEYAIKAFEAHAIDYLLKPFKNERFRESLARTIKIIESQNKPSLEDLIFHLNKSKKPENIIKIKEGKVIHYIDVNKITHVKSEGYYCNFHSSEKPKTIRISLKKIQEILPQNFIRINRSVVINRDKVSNTKTLKKSIEITMLNGDEFSAFYNLEEL